jgi:hypothetical protein
MPKSYTCPGAKEMDRVSEPVGEADVEAEAAREKKGSDASPSQAA